MMLNKEDIEGLREGDKIKGEVSTHTIMSTPILIRGDNTYVARSIYNCDCKACQEKNEKKQLKERSRNILFRDGIFYEWEWKGDWCNYYYTNIMIIKLDGTIIKGEES